MYVNGDDTSSIKENSCGDDDMTALGITTPVRRTIIRHEKINKFVQRFLSFTSVFSGFLIRNFASFIYRGMQRIKMQIDIMRSFFTGV